MDAKLTPTTYLEIQPNNIININKKGEVEVINISKKITINGGGLELRLDRVTNPISNIELACYGTTNDRNHIIFWFQDGSYLSIDMGDVVARIFADRVQYMVEGAGTTYKMSVKKAFDLLKKSKEG